jgi:multiple sugar transport system substrate-binding protein
MFTSHASGRRSVGLFLIIVNLLAACGGGTASPAGGSASALPTSAASTGSAAPAPVTFTLQRFFGTCNEEYGSVTDLTKAIGECAVITVLVNKFNAENKQGITVDARPVDFAHYYDQLNASFAANDPPDVFIVHRSALPDYVAGGGVAPVDDILKSGGVDANDLVPFAKDGLTYDGKLYASPLDLHTILWHMNNDIFKKAGLVDGSGNPIVPKSPEELLDQAAKVKAATGLYYIANETNGLMLLRWLTAWVAQQGSHLYDQACKVTIDTPEGLTALNLIKQIYDKGYADKTQTYDTANQAFLQGKAAVIVNGTWPVNDYINQKSKGGLVNYSVVSFAQVFKQPGSWADEHTFAVSARAGQDPAKAAAIGAWFKFLHDNSVAWATTGHLPPFKSALASPEFNALPFRSNFSSTADIAANAVPPVKHATQINTAITEALNAIPNGQIDPPSALKQAQQGVEAACSAG